MTAPDALAEVAGWDVPLLRGAVGTLGLVADRLAPWRFRLDDVGRQLAAAECWSGPAGTAAAEALRQVSTVSTGVYSALAASRIGLDVLVAAAAEAQELAAAALAIAEAGGVATDAAGVPTVRRYAPHPAMAADQQADLAIAEQAAVRVAALADQAFAAADRALIAARAATGALVQLGPVGTASRIGFDDLVPRLAPVGPVVPPAPPAGTWPEDASAWWATLSSAQQLAALRTWPAALGALDGLPGWARDQANRLQLAAALRDLPSAGAERAMVTAVAAQIARLEGAGQRVQLVQFDATENLVSLALGDIDTAGAVAVLVPGIWTTPADDLSALVGDARDVAAAAAAAATGLSVAVVVWLGYRTPVLSVPLGIAARRGGPALDRALDGLAAARSVPGAPGRPRTTVLAHSYGTLVASRAARAPGRLAADALVLLGSPGTAVRSAAELEVAEVHGAWSWADPISDVGWFGRGPDSPDFGATRLPTEVTQGHTSYYDPDRPTLAAIGQVVAGGADNAANGSTHTGVGRR